MFRYSYGYMYMTLYSLCDFCQEEEEGEVEYVAEEDFEESDMSDLEVCKRVYIPPPPSTCGTPSGFWILQVLSLIVDE